LEVAGNIHSWHGREENFYGHDAVFAALGS